MDVIALTQKLISFNTIAPPGEEYGIANFIGKILQEKGFDIDYPALAPNRWHIIAGKGLRDDCDPIVFSGHTDVVPLGTAHWNYDPFGGQIVGDLIYGRGASDMKSGVAAMLIAAINVSEKNLPKGGIKIVITAGEENGCEGARNLRESGYPIGGARCLIVGEPTSNVPYVGHKGGLFLYARAQGLTAHSSKPEIGDNAVYKVARAITKVEKLTFCGERDPLLGIPTINVGLVSGGQNFNSVPDSAEFTIDVRTTSEFTNAYALELLKKELTSEITLEPFVDLKPVTNDIEHPMIQKVLKICMARTGQDYGARAIGYLTDGSVLQSWMGDVPTVILGPGDPGMAHKTDEHCCVHKIREAVSIYEDIITNV